MPTELVTQKEWGIKQANIFFIKKGETKNVKDIARHLRNSVAHYNFKVFDNTSNKISSIKFTDKDFSDGTTTFEAIIPLASLRQFTTKLTDTLTYEMNQQK